MVAGLDSRYEDGRLDVSVQVSRLGTAAPGGYKLEALLYEDGASGPLVGKATVVKSSGSGSSSSSSKEEDEEVALSIPVKSPRQWSAETPNLYTLVVALSKAEGSSGGEDGLVQAESCRVGFRCVHGMDE